MYSLVARDFTAQIARRAVLYLSVFPSAFFLFAPFTEALFFALSVWTLYSARHTWWVWAGAFGLLAALTRTQGLFLVLPLAWEALHYHRHHRQLRWRSWLPFAVVAGPVCGFLLYNAYVWRTIELNVLQVQQAWGMRTTPPWTVISDSWRYVLAHASPIEGTNLFLIGVCTLLACIGIRKIPFSYTLVCAPQLVLLLTREMYHSPLMSVSRLLIVLFPLFVTLALYGRSPWFHRLWFSLSLFLLCVLLLFFLGGAFVA